MSIKSLEQINQEFLDEFILSGIKAPVRGVWDWGEDLPAPGADAGSVPVYKDDSVPVYQDDSVPVYQGDSVPVYIDDSAPAAEDDIPAFLLSFLEPVEETFAGEEETFAGEEETAGGSQGAAAEMWIGADEEGFVPEEGTWAEEEGFVPEEGTWAEEEGFVPEEGTWAEEEGYAADEEGYAADEEGAWNEEEGYAADEEGYAADEEEAWNEEEGYAADEEGYAADEAGYAADEEEAWAEEEELEADEYAADEDAADEDAADDDAADEDAVDEDEEAVSEKEKKAQKKSAARKVGDILFYTVVVLILFATLVFHNKTNESIQLFDYSAFTVLTGSMEREIPQGSLVITKKVDPQTIMVGDDITFVRSDNATVTHRVMDIIENYDDSGARGFETQGIANPDPDPDIVYAGNLVGVVKVTIPELGFTLKYISENIGLVFVLLGGVLVMAIAISKIFSGPKKTAPKGEPGVDGPESAEASPEAA